MKTDVPQAEGANSSPGVVPPSLRATPWSWRLAIAGGITGLAVGAYLLEPVIGPRGQAVVGVFFFFGLVAVFSANLRAVNWRTIGFGIALQVFLAWLVL